MIQLGGMKQEMLSQEAGDGSSTVGLHRQGHQLAAKLPQTLTSLRCHHLPPCPPVPSSPTGRNSLSPQERSPCHSWTRHQ